MTFCRLDLGILEGGLLQGDELCELGRRGGGLIYLGNFSDLIS